MSKNVKVPVELAESLRDYLDELLGEREWWRFEPRRTYQKEYAEMVETLEEINKIIENDHVQREKNNQGATR